ncbi:MAG: type II toxin-antitoxin system HicB family antitoxin [Candidatus Aminicenantes bacterium]|nr:type II toxin-antitoxin system HicB family antitoxin [Candidatus Aminicenantes bacterium]
MIKPFEAIAVFCKDEEGYFQAFSPNVEGAISYGETLEEARANIKEAVEGVIKTALDKDIVNYFQSNEYKANEGEIVEVVKIDRKLQVAVSIKIAREQAGYSQRDIGKKLGITQQSISRYEKGVVIPSADKFLELLEA